MVGKGWLNGTQTHLDFLPERHTDFIFAVFGEEFGLIGNAVLLVLYLLLIGRGMMITAERVDAVRAALAGAITLMFFTYAFVNMGMVSGVLPVVGVPLPLVSYGGTALIVAVHRARHPDERAGAPQARQHVESRQPRVRRRRRMSALPALSRRTPARASAAAAAPASERSGGCLIAISSLTRSSAVCVARRQLDVRRAERRRARAPAHEVRAPGEAGAERRHQDQRARLDAAFLERIDQRDRNRRRRHVAVALTVT